MMADCKPAGLVSDCKLNLVDFSGAEGNGTHFVRVSCVRGRFLKAKLAGCSLEEVVLIASSLDGANLTGTTTRSLVASLVSLRSAILEGCDFSYADLCRADFSAARISSTNFERASLLATQWLDTVVDDGNLEFADLSNAVFTRSWFGRSNFVGAVLEGAQFVERVLAGADFCWSDFEDSKCFSCRLKDMRRPEEQKIAYGPKGVKPPHVVFKRLYRQAITDEERKKPLARCFEPGSEK
jgi:uncharacterized protein YjbI with pentapeptide repeats